MQIFLLLSQSFTIVHIDVYTVNSNNRYYIVLNAHYVPRNSLSYLHILSYLILTKMWRNHYLHSIERETFLSLREKCMLADLIHAHKCTYT